MADGFFNVKSDLLVDPDGGNSYLEHKKQYSPYSQMCVRPVDKPTVGMLN